MKYPWQHNPPPGNPNYYPPPPLPHHQNPNFESPGYRPQMPYNQNPNLETRNYHQNPNEFGQNPGFQSPVGYNQNPSLESRNYHQNPSFQSPYDQSPNLENRNYHHYPNFEAPSGYNQNPDLGNRIHHRNPNEFGQNPSFQSPIGYNHNPNLDYERPRNNEFGQTPTFQPAIVYNQNPNLDYERPRNNEFGQNPSVRPPIGYNPNSNLENRNYHQNASEFGQDPSFQSPIAYNQNPNMDFRNRNGGAGYPPLDRGFERVRPDIAYSENPEMDYTNNNGGAGYPPFDCGLERPRPNMDHRNYNNDNIACPPLDHGYKRPRADELSVGKASFVRPGIAHNQSPNLDYRNYNDGVGYSPFDHGYERPRLSELGVGDKDRRLKLVRDHGAADLISADGGIRGSLSENSGLKRPRFDESGVGRNYNYESNGYQDGFYQSNREELSSETSFRETHEQRLDRDDFYSQSHDIRSSLPLNHDIHPSGHSHDRAFGHNVLATSSQISPQGRSIYENNDSIGVARGISIHTPQPVTPPTPLLMDPQGPLFTDQHTPASEAKMSSLFPISVTPTTKLGSSLFPQTYAKPNGDRYSMKYSCDGPHIPLIPLDMPKAIDASRIFKQPHRATRPDHIVVILRGLPGSGKSYMAKMMRDLEVENGGKAPRIHSMDDYFMIEVEKVEESDNLKSSGSARGKKAVPKMVMEYCYEAEMEEAYRSSMLKTFKKTLDEGAFPIVIVDDRNLRVADFAQFWATAKRSGYEVYLLEAMYKDPVGCAARNVHGFTLDGIQRMADQWEEAPSLYLKLDAKSLLKGDDLKENDIQEVDMDTEDGPAEDALYASAERKSDISEPATRQLSPSGPSKTRGRWNDESGHSREEVKELGRSKWSNDLEDDDVKGKEASAGNVTSVSVTVKAKSKEGKSVHWGDQAANIGFSIGARKRVNTSLVIGPGSGYNSKANPLPEDNSSHGSGGKSNHQSVFQERIRAEREGFRAVFDKRRHRIGGLDLDDE